MQINVLIIGRFISSYGAAMVDRDKSMMIGQFNTSSLHLLWSVHLSCTVCVVDNAKSSQLLGEIDYRSNDVYQHA